MFLRLFLFLLSVAALTRAAAVLGAAQSGKTACARFTLPMCTREYDPVCGSDGQLYPNECMLCFYNMKNHLNAYAVKKGEC